MNMGRIVTSSHAMESSVFSTEFRSAMTAALNQRSSPESNGDDHLHRRVMEVADSIGDFIAYWGFKSIHGRVWTVIALRGEPTTQAQVCQLLGSSRASVSTVVSELVDHGLLKAVDDRRNAPYVAVFDFWPVVADVLRKREWILLERARLALEAAVEAAEREHRRGSSHGFAIERMKQLLRLTEVGQSVLKVLISVRNFEATEKLGSWAREAGRLVRRLGGGN